MGLDRTKLSRELRSLFGGTSGVGTIPAAKERWARAYHSYATGAEDVSGDRVQTANRPGFLGALQLRNGASTREAAQMFDRAFVAYWTGAVFGVGQLIAAPSAQCPNIGGNGIWASEVSSVVVGVLEGVLAGLLQPEFESLRQRDTAFSKAEVLARAFHRATTTAVMVLITGLDTTPGPTGPLVITNTCTIR